MRTMCDPRKAIPIVQRLHDNADDAGRIVFHEILQHVQKPDIGFIAHSHETGEATAKRSQTGRNTAEKSTTVRNDGYARSRGSVVPGRDVVAVQFATPPGVPPLALGVSGDIDQMDLELDSVLAILRKAATTLAPEPDPVPAVESASAHTAPGRASRWHPE